MNKNKGRIELAGEDWENFKQLAEERGYRIPTHLARAIARGEVPLGAKFDAGESEALKIAFDLMHEGGYSVSAEALGKMLLEKGQLSKYVREVVEKKLGNSTIAKDIKLLIKQKKPFIIEYPSSGTTKYYTVRWGEVSGFRGENHLYLKAWVDEESNRAEIQQLNHNRTFRPDKIVAISVPDNLRWRSNGLDKILVTLKINPALAKNYDAKAEDIFIDSDKDGGIIVRRNVYFWHFFKREVMRYGSECRVIAPEIGLKLMQEEINLLLEWYTKGS